VFIYLIGAIKDLKHIRDGDLVLVSIEGDSISAVPFASNFLQSDCLHIPVVVQDFE